METITIRTREKGQMDFLRALLANLRWDAEVEYGGGAETLDADLARAVAKDELLDGVRTDIRAMYAGGKP